MRRRHFGNGRAPLHSGAYPSIDAAQRITDDEPSCPRTHARSPRRMNDELPRAVRDLIHECLPSMDHVEVLLALDALADGESDEQRLGRDARLSASSARHVVDDLVACGLVVRTKTSGVTRTPFRAAAVAALA